MIIYLNDNTKIVIVYPLGEKTNNTHIIGYF